MVSISTVAPREQIVPAVEIVGVELLTDAERMFPATMGSRFRRGTCLTTELIRLAVIDGFIGSVCESGLTYYNNSDSLYPR